MNLDEFLIWNMKIEPEAIDIVNKASRYVANKFKDIDKLVEYNQARVIMDMRTCQVSERHFLPSTGYGYSDLGREKLEDLFASIFGAEDALVRPHWCSGTHVISDALYAVLRPGDTLMSITGKPYDTLEDSIGLNPKPQNSGSLIDWKINYKQVELKENGKIDINQVKEEMEKENIKALFIQRSRGYEWRPSISIEEMKETISTIKEIYPNTFIIVDNCYGEFTSYHEPSHAGADLVVGSLIKNPGGGLAPTGGYAVGTKKAIELMSYRLTSPAIGRDVGSYAALYLPFFQGVFMAPHVVGQALKGAILTSKVFESLGYKVLPSWDDDRDDIIQCIRFNNSDELISFCQAIQGASPVDSHVTPFPWEMPGYNHEVIMAAGTFVQGASIELSADAPIIAPYNAYLQGGLTYEHVKLALMSSITKLIKNGFCKESI